MNSTQQTVTLVIPSRNAADTLPACLEACARILGRDGLKEIILVDDHSTDDTAAIVARYPVTYLQAGGYGPGAARNTGWRHAKTPLVWFIDADCVPHPSALRELRRGMANAGVAAVGGSYANLCRHSLLSCLIHEEIMQRHLAMPDEVNFLATYNVLYRRDVLVELNGFEEELVNCNGSCGAEDAELAFRVQNAGYRLRFCTTSRVGHYHQTDLRTYFRVQHRHGYWRVPLYLRHLRKSFGDSYSNLIDHVQPPLAMLLLVALLASGSWKLIAICAALLLAAQVPMTWRMCRRLRQWRYLSFAPLSLARSFFRGLGMCRALVWVVIWAGHYAYRAAWQGWHSFVSRNCPVEPLPRLSSAIVQCFEARR